MAKQVIQLGTPPSGVGGDTPRSANIKINSNFDELYAAGAAGTGLSFLVSTDLNTALDRGVYAFNTPSANGPSFSYGVLEVQPRSSVEIVQIARDLFTGKEEFRVFQGGAWTRWFRSFSQHNIIGAVSWDSAAGIPGGAILERTDNANGTALRFADGTQINYFETVMAVNVNTQNQNAFYGLAPYWTYPLAFLGGVPAVRADAHLSGVLAWTARNDTQAHAAQVAVMTPGYVTNGNFNMSFTAIGKWR